MNETDSENVLMALVDLATQDERCGMPSASNWKRYELCAGSYQLGGEARRLGMEAFRTSPDAESGERIHAVLAGEKVELSDSERTSVGFLEERAADQVSRIFADRPVTVLNEVRLWLKPKRLSGRADRIYHAGDTALVVDWKTGFREPDSAESNSQLKVLAVLAVIHLPHLKNVYVQIISGPFGVSEAQYSFEQLRTIYKEMLVTLERINDPEAPFSPSFEACRYCPAMRICKAVDSLVKPVTALQYSPLPKGERAARLLDELEVVERHIKTVRDYYFEQLSGDPDYRIPGWGLVPGAPIRRVKDWANAKLRLEEFIPSEALSEIVSFSITEVEKLLGQAIGVKGPKLKEQLASILGDLLELKHPEPSLKRVKGEPTIAAL